VSERRAIVNADDFGLSPGTNRGIVEAFRDGILTSTTMLVNLEAFADAVRLARAAPDLPVGIHLSLLWGRPLTDAARVPTLVGRDGCFPRSLPVLARRYVLGRLSLDEVALEFRGQIRRFLDTGLVPTHLDSHKHVHCLPGVFRTLVAVAREFSIERVRLPDERPPRGHARAPVPRPGWRPRARRRLIGALCARSRACLRGSGLRTNDHFVGIEQSDGLNSQVLESILYALEAGTTEIMCHPGYVDDELKRFARIPPHREIELQALLDPAVKRHVADAGVRLCSYRDV
jgi:hopanoid biosynthesis associated protein HpnK